MSNKHVNLIPSIATSIKNLLSPFFGSKKIEEAFEAANQGVIDDSFTASELSYAVDSLETMSKSNPAPNPVTPAPVTPAVPQTNPGISQEIAKLKGQKPESPHRTTLRIGEDGNAVSANTTPVPAKQSNGNPNRTTYTVKKDPLDFDLPVWQQNSNRR